MCSPQRVVECVDEPDSFLICSQGAGEKLIGRRVFVRKGGKRRIEYLLHDHFEHSCFAFGFEYPRIMLQRNLLVFSIFHITFLKARSCLCEFRNGFVIWLCKTASLVKKMSITLMLLFPVLKVVW